MVAALAAGVVALWAGATVAAPADSLAAVDAARARRGREILERAAERAGGLDAWRAARDVRFRMVMTGYQDGKPGLADTTAVMFRLHGGRRYREEAPDGTVLGCDGTRGWALRGGVPAMAPMDSVMGLFQAGTVSLWFEAPFRFLDPDFQVTYLGAIDVGGRRCDVVQALERVKGRPRERCDAYCAYFDSTARMLGSNFTRVAVRENQPRLAVWFDEWARVGAFEVPRVCRMYRLGGSLLPDLAVPLLEYRRSDIRFDVGAPDSLFAAPRR
jgi:hypothetical protein